MVAEHKSKTTSWKTLKCFGEVICHTLNLPLFIINFAVIYKQYWLLFYNFEQGYVEIGDDWFYAHLGSGTLLSNPTLINTNSTFLFFCAGLGIFYLYFLKLKQSSQETSTETPESIFSTIQFHQNQH